MQKTERKTQKTGRKVHILERGSSAPTTANPYQEHGDHITKATTHGHDNPATTHTDQPAATTSQPRRFITNQPAAHI